MNITDDHCPYCGGPENHGWSCYRIAAISFYPNATVSRIEYNPKMRPYPTNRRAREEEHSTHE